MQCAAICWLRFPFVLTATVSSECFGKGVYCAILTCFYQKFSALPSAATDRPRPILPRQPRRSEARRRVLIALSGEKSCQSAGGASPIPHQLHQHWIAQHSAAARCRSVPPLLHHLTPNNGGGDDENRHRPALASLRISVLFPSTEMQWHLCHLQVPVATNEYVHSGTIRRSFPAP